MISKEFQKENFEFWFVIVHSNQTTTTINDIRLLGSGRRNNDSTEIDTLIAPFLVGKVSLRLERLPMIPKAHVLSLPQGSVLFMCALEHDVRID